MNLVKGDCFGIESFFTGLDRNSTIRITEFSKLFYIKRSDFINLIKQYDEDFQ